MSTAELCSSAYPHLQPYLTACAQGELPANIALMRLMMEASSVGELNAALEAASRRASLPTELQRLASLRDLLMAHPAAFAMIRQIKAEAAHDRKSRSCGQSLAFWRRVYDRLAESWPEAGVALYSLGSPELLAAATTEVIACLRAWNLVQPSFDLLEIGCGTGRFVCALAPQMASVTGVDISEAMIARARERCDGLSNVKLAVTSGRDLADFANASVDLVLAADVFPYLVQEGGSLPRRHIDEAARILRRQGSLVIFNYSYRDCIEADRQELGAHLREAGFSVERNGTRDLQLWDAPSFVARKRL